MIGNLKQKTYEFLRKTQKYTGTDNVYLAKGGFWLSLGKFFALGISFLSAIAFANLLNPATYGNYKYVLSLVGMLGIFSLTGISTAISQAVARGLEGSFYAGFKTRLKWALLGSLVALGMAGYYWRQGNNLLILPLILTAIFLPLLNASHLYTSFLSGKKIFNAQAQYGILSQVISTGAIIAALFLTKNLFWLIAVYFISNTFLESFFYLLTKFKFRPNKKEDSQTIPYGKYLTLLDIVSVVGSYLDKILLFSLVGPAQLAIYSFATLPPEQLKGFAEENINSLAFPKLAAKSPEEIKANIMKKVWRLAILAGIMVMGYFLLAPYIYKIFFPQYLNSILYSQIFTLSFIFLPTIFLSNVFEAKMMKKELYTLKLIISPLKIILYLILIPLYGIWGVIAAILLAGGICAALTLFLFRRV